MLSCRLLIFRILQDSKFCIDRSTVVEIPVESLLHSFPVIKERLSHMTISFIGKYTMIHIHLYMTKKPADADKDVEALMPNPWRVKAKGKPVYCLQLRIWQDDVSGNRSKQWNKHWIYCMNLAGLPKQLLVQEYFTRFISCSPFAKVTEQAEAIKKAIE